MRLIDLHIYGFGRLEDVIIENLRDFQVFYGENEAGKSTIMAFIHAVLFGFPTKQQAELRYVPKQGAKYGGKLRLSHPQYGIALVERVKGKAAGDVTVTLENGQSGGEELLKDLLFEMDKDIFQAVFSFNLHGLQNIHQMKGEELNQFLFSAGTLGTDRLTAVELQLQKELDHRFKTTGKKPVLNEKLQEVDLLNKELKKAAAKNQSYESLTGEEKAVEMEMADLQKRINQIRTRIEKLNEWKKVSALVKEEKWLEQELEEIGQVTFPARGIERYEQFNQLLKPCHAQLSSLNERINQVQNQLESIEPDINFLQNQAEIEAAANQFPLYHQFRLQEKQLEAKLGELNDKIGSIKEQLHLQKSDETVGAINTNLYIKDQVQKLDKKRILLDQSKQELENHFAEEKRKLEDLEAAAEAAKAELLPDAERSSMEAEAKKAVDRGQVEANIKAIREKIAFYQAANEREKRQIQQKSLQYFIFGLLLLVLIVYSWSIQQTLLTIIGAFLLFVIAAFFVKGLKNKSLIVMGETLGPLFAEERKWQEYLASSQYATNTIVLEKLSMDNNRREQLQILRVKLEHQQHLFDKVVDQFEVWESDASAYAKEIEKISLELNIPKELAKKQLAEAFLQLDQLKTFIRGKRQLQTQLEQLRVERRTIWVQLGKTAERYLGEKETDLQKAVFLLRTKLNEEQEKMILVKAKREKLQEMEENRRQLQQEKNHLQAEIDQLMAEANAEKETDFFAKGELFTRKVKLEERLTDVKQQLHYCFLSKLERNSYLHIPNCEEIIEEHHLEAERLQKTLQKKQERLAAKRHEIQLLEEGGVYSELLHQLKLKQTELAEEVNEWAVFRIAQDILLQTVEKYKNIHLPRMLTQAENYLSFLTEGRYCKIILHPKKTGFLIERDDHILFEAYELSQATMEQVYVSIRLALSTTLFAEFPFPILIDDSFVNFDGKRTQRMMELLKNTKQNQILFFTCHQHLLDYFSNTDTLFLQKGAVQRVC